MHTRDHKDEHVHFPEHHDGGLVLNETEVAVYEPSDAATHSGAHTGSTSISLG